MINPLTSYSAAPIVFEGDFSPQDFFDTSWDPLFIYFCKGAPHLLDEAEKGSPSLYFVFHPPPDIPGTRFGWRVLCISGNGGRGGIQVEPEKRSEEKSRLAWIASRTSRCIG